MRLTVLAIANPFFAMGPSGTGAEQIAGAIDRAIVARGWDSLLIAAAGSRTAGRLAALLPGPGASRGEYDAALPELRSRVSELSRSVDLIHCHGLGFHEYLARGRAPIIVTLHAAPAYYPRQAFEIPGVHWVAVSRHQANSLADIPGLRVIENGVDLTMFRPRFGTRRGLAFIGRISPEKGADVALRIAHALDLPLTIAGPLHPFAAHQRYFHQQVEPLLDDRRLYAGPIDADDKIALLSSVRCLLVPSDPARVSETSSLVAMEAIASGVPVVAFRSGALPGVIEHGLTGFLADSERAMMQYVPEASRISPADCRARAEERFDLLRMMRQYFSLYEEALRGR